MWTGKKDLSEKDTFTGILHENNPSAAKTVLFTHSRTPDNTITKDKMLLTSLNELACTLDLDQQFPSNKNNNQVHVGWCWNSGQRERREDREQVKNNFFIYKLHYPTHLACPSRHLTNGITHPTIISRTTKIFTHSRGFYTISIASWKLESPSQQDIPWPHTVMRSGGPSPHALKSQWYPFACHSMFSSEQFIYMKGLGERFPHPSLYITSLSLIITPTHCELSLQMQQYTRDASLATNSRNHFPKLQLL